VSEVRNCCGQQFSVVFLRRQEDKVDETFGHPRRQVGNIDVLLPLYVFSNYLIDFAVQTMPVRLSARGVLNRRCVAMSCSSFRLVSI
jgi:hypothetical protein